MTLCVITLILSFAALWGAALFVVPSHVRSLFRYRLWRLRDYLQDCIFDERLPDVPVVNDLLEGIEGMIEYADHVSLSTFLAFELAGGHSLGDADLDLSRLSDKQQELFGRILRTLFDHMMFKAIAGSPAGAFFLPVLLLLLKLRNKFWARPLVEPEAEFRHVRDFRVSVLARRGKPTRDELVASVG
jgi:hypothetical protein